MKNPGITGETVSIDNQVGELTGEVVGDMRHISIDAERFKFSPNVVRVKQGETIMLMIDNADTMHGINIPAFNAKGNNMVTFKADKKGEFKFYCENMCGSGHSGMRGTLIVE